MNYLVKEYIGKGICIHKVYREDVFKDVMRR